MRVCGLWVVVGFAVYLLVSSYWFVVFCCGRAYLVCCISIIVTLLYVCAGGDGDYIFL